MTQISVMHPTLGVKSRMSGIDALGIAVRSSVVFHVFSIEMHITFSIRYLCVSSRGTRICYRSHVLSFADPCLYSIVDRYK